MPEIFETVVLTEEGHENVPHADVPFYIDAQESYFLVKPTQIGRVFLPERTKPKSIPKLGHAGGVFTWKGDPIPGHIVSQAHDFFKRIYEAKHSEAEVLITKHNDTDEYRLFVPYQRVSHMGVKSIYEPTHVSREYTVVGTLHSHCDFGAFHSGTDSGDASDMDGVHFTIGKVNSPTPEIVAMVAMNGKEFHYTDPSDIADIAFGTTTAPAWWDSYVFGPNDDIPKDIPSGFVSLTQEHWNEFLGRPLVKPKPQATQKPWNYSKSDNGWERYGPVREQYNQQGVDWRAQVYGGWKPVPVSEVIGGPEDPTINAVLDMAERAGIFTDYDWEDISAKDMDDVKFWRKFFTDRLIAAGTALDALGVTVSVSTINKKGKK